MNKRTFLKFFALTSSSLVLANGHEPSSAAHHTAPNTQELQEIAKKMFGEVISQNDYYVNHHGSTFLKNSKMVKILVQQ